MRDKKEFEEYVKTLGMQKKQERRRKTVKLRRIAIAAGSSLAACLCVVLILSGQKRNTLSQNDSGQEVYKSYDTNGNDGLYENANFAPQQQTGKTESSTEAAVEGETSTEKEEEGDADYDE